MTAATGAEGDRPIQRGLHWLFDGPLLGPIVAFAGSTILSVGPWLVSVLVLSLISIALTPVLGRSGISDVRLSVAYGFAIALLVAAPLAVLTARLTRRAAERQNGLLVPELYTVCLLVSGIGTQIVALATVFFFSITPIGLSVAFVILAANCAMLITGFGLLMALGETWRLIGTFLFGIMIGLAAALLTTRWATTVESLIWSFSLGLWVSHHLMYTYATRGAPLTLDGLGRAFDALRTVANRSQLLFWGIVCANLGIWADKAVFWFAPTGIVADSGFYHFAPYDSVMFLAHLSMIPTVAAWFLFQRHVLEPRVQAFWRLAESQPTRAALLAEVSRLQDLVWGNVFRILFIQFACSSILVMMTPVIIRGFGLRFDQIELLQIGFVAVLLQSLLFLSCSVMMICGRTSLLFSVNLAFLLLNVAGGILFYNLFGVSAYGVFVASLVSGALAFVLAYRALGDFVFVVFIKENDDLYSPPKSRLGAFADRLPIRRRKPPAARPPRKNPVPNS